MDLLGNAIESIRTGVVDYANGEHSRLLASVRSIHSGILLLYKEALRRLSPEGSNEALVRAKILPRRNVLGNVEFVGEGRKTADVQQIKERFGALGIGTDWTRFDQITNGRNDIEHYYTKANKRALEGLVSNAFVVARNCHGTKKGPAEIAWR
jgi:hypothetical protein